MLRSAASRRAEGADSSKIEMSGNRIIFADAPFEVRIEHARQFPETQAAKAVAGRSQRRRNCSAKRLAPVGKTGAGVLFTVCSDHEFALSFRPSPRLPGVHPPAGRRPGRDLRIVRASDGAAPRHGVGRLGAARPATGSRRLTGASLSCFQGPDGRRAGAGVIASRCRSTRSVAVTGCAARALFMVEGEGNAGRERISDEPMLPPTASGCRLGERHLPRRSPNPRRSAGFVPLPERSACFASVRDSIAGRYG